ncbi:unnamed protein product [Rhizoctonia solani]|uniref:Uncharacterized protein n=1 Tax=Rhizoctonia solani TaxID=456999 RepID=A0A8H3ACJ1_9AGAM|nr:unnamed protein product [Rhizoctonia solani]
MLSNKRDPTAKCLLRFSEEFFDPTDDISKWHDQQQSSRFRTIQYRKERTGVGHEFILLLLQKEQGGDVDCYCRIERVGDPQHLAQVVCIDGTIAEDYIQAIPLSDPVSANLIDNSDVVAEITFPQTFMLRDVLAICYGISNHYRAKRYTLQQYNCYFFSWSLILALARGCMNWDVSPSIPEHVNNMHDRIMQSIYDQGPARFRSSAYILSNKTFANHENEQHPLDQALSSRLCRSGFTDSITTALKDVLWADRLHIRLIENIDGELVELASESVDLTTCDESQSEGMNSPVTQDKRDLDFEYALGSLTQKAALVVLEGVFQVNSQVVAGVFPTSALFKQRLGHEVWCKELARGLRHPGRLFSRVDEEVPSCEPANPHGHQPTSSSIRDLCFIPPAVLLGFSARLMFTSERELEGLIGQANAEKGFRVRKSDNELSQVGVFNLDSHGGVAQTVKISKLVLSCDAPVTSRDGDVWSHQDLQHYIRQRISQLSKRETSFAPYLKRIPFLKSPEVCQKEIEVTMEEIWIASSPLMKPQSYTA